MSSPVDLAFRAAVAFVRAHAGESIGLTDQQRLEIYALFKHGTTNAAKQGLPPRPSDLFGINLLGKAKWDAWHRLSLLNLTAAEARAWCVR